MQEVIRGENYRIYAENLEENVLKQFSEAMAQDFVVEGALMADAHLGYSLPIGAVVATRDVIVPSWVGYDIGCGMCALPLPFISAHQVKSSSEDIFKLIYDSIPMGFKINEEPISYSNDGLSLDGKVLSEKKNYRCVLGSLGSGNHFIEISADSKDNVWIIIHSGSRGVGHGIATHYIKAADPDGKCKEGHNGLNVESEIGKAYIQDLNWCLDFALENRREMMRRVISCISSSLELLDYNVDWTKLINRNHNHAIQRNGLWIHRKGATHAEAGMLGVIPGNMRDGSFIVRGKGDPCSLYSSSHGAGRVYSRKRAKAELTMEDFQKQMEGITALVENGTLDESPSAYKDIFRVMELQKDLVEIVAHVKPIINIKA